MTLRRGVFVLLIALVVSSCGADPEVSATTSESTAPPTTTLLIAALEGTTWELITYGVEAKPTKANAERPTTVTFDDGEVNGMGPCNRYSGTYVTRENEMMIELQAITRAGCGDRDLDLVEQEYFEALGNAERYDVIGQRMKIEYGKGLSLVFEAR
ncbi:MAG: META domain-containing protein [Acidimicrobiia bacterium]|nr:META domain-containing protein [Acidimicrobiia bacterium]